MTEICAPSRKQVGRHSITNIKYSPVQLKQFAQDSETFNSEVNMGLPNSTLRPDDSQLDVNSELLEEREFEALDFKFSASKTRRATQFVRPALKRSLIRNSIIEQTYPGTQLENFIKTSEGAKDRPSFPNIESDDSMHLSYIEY